MLAFLPHKKGLIGRYKPFWGLIGLERSVLIPAAGDIFNPIFLQPLLKNPWKGGAPFLKRGLY